MEFALFVLVTLTSPLLLLLAVLVDAVLLVVRRKRPMAVRLVAMLWWFLAGELRGLALLFCFWVAALGRDTPSRRRRVYHLRQTWAAGHLGAVTRLFKLRWEVDGLEHVAPGPVLILMRHASIIDNAMPDALFGRAHDLGLRFILKRELRMLATIDIGGGWVPTAFVARGSGDTERELETLRTLAIDLQPDEGILLYPEGTRHTDKKLARAQEIIRERQPEIAPLADALHNVLPPRLGGPLTLLDATRGHDVVFCGHVGLDGFEYISDIWSGGLVGGTVSVKFWRHAAATIPEDRDELVRWLYAQWQILDDWVGVQRQH